MAGRKTKKKIITIPILNTTDGAFLTGSFSGLQSGSYPSAAASAVTSSINLGYQGSGLTYARLDASETFTSGGVNFASGTSYPNYFSMNWFSARKNSLPR